MTDVSNWLYLALAITSVYSIVLTLGVVRAKQRQRRQAKAQQRVIPHGGTIRSTAQEQASQRFLDKADEAMRFNQTFQKFVPKQFVDHFAKHGSDVLELGHADEDEVAILFCDIRGFTGLSERMSPQELMNFLNSYFLRMNAPIHQNRGFIDKFIGDAIMALFDHPGGSPQQKAYDAILAAIDLRNAIFLYNQHRANSGYEGINIGVGIHFGPVIIGTVGSDDRMDTTVIGDSVNIAFRLEGLAPKYHADIVISEQVRECLSGEEGIEYRPLDWVRVKGRQAPVKIYEVFNHLPDHQKQAKLATKALIEQGLQLRIQQDFEAALAIFEQALSVNPDDPLLLHHIESCRHYQTQTLPSDWDGSFSMRD